MTLSRGSLSGAIARAAEHVFERNTVVADHELTAEILRQSYGQHSLAAVKTGIHDGNHGFLHA
ncbi:hypothetical protein JZU54_01235, partial [bacterium]|nr:hypothetical protein [bacterium]